MLSYPAGLDLSTATLRFVADHLTAHRAAIRSRWRRLPAGQQGSTHDLTAARTHDLIHALSKAAVATFADKGYQGAGGAVGTPTKGRDLPEGIRAVNTAHAKIRAVGERANATLKTWRLLRKVRCCPHRVTALAAAILTLETQPR